uniref:Uncharacterized protein n=1 Tax=Tanacetum cinerariifolium TaxID=118510 RepID=A0A6L2KAV8_TANCI|nr:hypothetical protein [Tanacetum cinerariifolium]
MKDDPKLQKDDVSIWLALKIKFEGLQVATTPCRPSTVRPRDQDDPHDAAHPEGENSTKMQKISEHKTFEIKRSSSGQDYEGEPGLSMLEERTSKRVKTCMKRVNPYARYKVEHWKNPHEKTFYIKNQQAPGKTKEEIYSNSKIVQIIKTYWELGHKNKFIIKIVARRENGSILSITKSDYKNVNKNDIKDMYLLIINHKVDDYAETGLLWSLPVFIKSTRIKERVYDFQLRNRCPYDLSKSFPLHYSRGRFTIPADFFFNNDLEYLRGRSTDRKYTASTTKTKTAKYEIEEPQIVIYEDKMKRKRLMRTEEHYKLSDGTLTSVRNTLDQMLNNLRLGYNKAMKRRK